MSKRGDFLNLAKKQLGIKSGDKFRKWYNANVGNIGAGNWAWCAAGISWCAAQLGLSRVILSTASAPGMLHNFQNAGRFKRRGTYTPKGGDIIIFKWSWDPVGDASHVGVVEYADDSSVHTIEFNSGNSYDGEVARWSYSLGNSAIVGYGVPDFPEDVKKVKLKGKGAIYEYAYKDILGKSSKALKTVQAGAKVEYIDGTDDSYGWSKVRSGSVEGWMMNSHLDADGLSRFPTEILKADTRAVQIKNKTAAGEAVLKKGTEIVVICEIEQGSYKGQRYVAVGGKRYYIK